MPLDAAPDRPTFATAPYAAGATPATPPKRLVVLVHGIGGSRATWATLLAIAADDPALAEFRFEPFEYSTGVGRFHPLRRLPTLDTIASELRGFLETGTRQAYRDVRLVGHSQGGLIIQRYLHDMLDAGRGRELDRLRQVMFFATPTLGSTLGGGLRRVLFALLSNPQELELRPFNPAVANARRYVDDHVTKAVERGPHDATIPIHAFFGEEDNVVDPESAKSSFSSYFAIPGDHSAIIRPTSRHDRRYEAFVEQLLNPIGHRNVFDVARSEIVLRLEPYPAGVYQAVLPGGASRAVRSECVAHLTRRVRFAHTNRCEQLFDMKYATEQDGFVEARAHPPNEWPDELRREYERRGTTFHYQFHPVPQTEDEHAMFLRIYGGYDAGHRNVHFHATRAGERLHARFREWHFTLDLSALVSADWRIVREPTLHLLDVDRGHEECPTADDDDEPGALGEPVAPEPDAADGVRHWILRELERGIVNVMWDVAPPAVHRTTSPRAASGV